ncbi:hypothetical protein SAMN05421643_101319 [Acinetobacter kyonggiensis]|uniref:Uncharacterized protein n=1 Tax=Acinetobacter kyonggiensis TaxID=595670 RepID=A0A1H3FX39_9GAMM|nr:hypothetical protein SAMN05421643_101319 [Acinetobacter kyonggiensis]
MPTFVIREKFFGYNDEVFYVAGNRIANIFQDQALAEQQYKQLEIAAARNFALYEVASFFDATEDELQKYDDFVFSRCGEHIVKLLYYSYKIRKKLEITHRLSRSTILYAYV